MVCTRGRQKIANTKYQHRGRWNIKIDYDFVRNAPNKSTVLTIIHDISITYLLNEMQRCVIDIAQYYYILKPPLSRDTNLTQEYNNNNDNYNSINPLRTSKSSRHYPDDIFK